MNGRTLAFRFEASLHNSHSKYDQDKNFVRRTCDVRRVVFLHLALYSYVPRINLGQCMTRHQFRAFRVKTSKYSISVH